MATGCANDRRALRDQPQTEAQQALTALGASSSVTSQQQLEATGSFKHLLIGVAAMQVLIR
jgi:hypothetical protein